MSRVRRTHARRGRRGREPELPAPVRRTRPTTVDVTWVGGEPFLGAAAIRKAARAALAEGRRPNLRLSIACLTDRRLAGLHDEWLGDPSPTDVLSFDLSDGTSESGEILVSHECARRTARARAVDARRELSLYVVHGVLHLCGHDDHGPRDRARMRAAEARVLASLGWAPDSHPHDETDRRSRRGA